MANSPQDQTAQLKTDIETWKKGYEKLQTEFQKLQQEHKQLGAQVVNQSTELIDAKDDGEKIKGLLKDMTDEKNKAVGLLRTLTDHVAGRTGMLGKSKVFCGVCENPHMCPISKVIEFIGEPAEAA